MEKSTLRRLFPADRSDSDLSRTEKEIVTEGEKVCTPPETVSNKGKTGAGIIVINVSEA